ncbi:MAG: 3-deoxy-8-phosphooctulonate synthase [Candidatus Latescibacteria bacterium]|nr:3-deoxy-8-phosphooctulonate synthase [Candidatus Latescibacterota bacterium]
MKMPYVFKASYDKANRSSIDSPRGPGLEAGLEILAKIREEFDVPVLSDVHEPRQAEYAGQTLDCIQIPAFLCRQTDLIVAAAKTGKAVNIKKGQFMAPWDMKHVVGKLESGGCRHVLLGERGTFFGYGRLVNDMRAIVVMRQLGYPVIFDATHSVQHPGGAGSISGGNPEFIFPLARAAVAVGVDAVFIETHPCPSEALCDAASMLPLGKLEELLRELKRLDEVKK